MSNYIFPSDIEDELLGPLIQMTDIVKASAYIDMIAKTYGVDPALIPTDPVPDAIIELAVTFACGRRAKLASGIGTRLDSSGIDIYEIKRRVYAKQLIDLTSSATKATFTGSTSTSADSYSTGIELFRC